MRSLFLLLLFGYFIAGEAAPTVISLRGHLGKEEMAQAIASLDKMAQGDAKVVIEVDSTSGDLNQVLEFAKKVYALKIQRKIPLTVYIEENAVGPAAILPFLADDLYISLFVSWGDIPLGSEKAISTNLLRNQVVSLIPSDVRNAKLLKLMAAAMSDPAIQIVEEDGWKSVSDARSKTSPMISNGSETLVVNHNQLRDLGIVAGVLSLSDFRQKLQIEQQQASVSSSPSGLAISPKGLEEELQAHIKYNLDGTNLVGHITIDDRTSGINQSTWLYVKKALDYYKEKKPIFIILELNTPGGEVFASQKISDALKEFDTQYNTPVFAFINNWAISAGAMLAYSCRYIAIAKDASMGAAEPVIGSQSGEMKEASEKINSALRTDFANRASFFNRNPFIAEAMVDKDLILVMRYGRIIKLDSEGQIRTSGPDPDVVISPKGKLLTLNAEQMMEYGVADILLLPTKLEPISEEERELGKWPAKKVLLFQQPFIAKIPNAIVDSYHMDWKTRFFVFLANPIVSSLLVLGVMMGFYLEVSTPGFGLPGTIALLSLFLIILSTLSLEIANWLEVILLVTGIAIILVDLFVLPTFGLLGVIGVVLFFAGLFGMMLPEIGSVSFDFDTHTLNAAGSMLLDRLAWLGATLVLGFILILLMARYVTPSAAAWSRLVLTGSEQDAAQGYIAGERPQNLPPPGTKGEVFATLRPAGKVLINDTVYDAITAGNFIEKGTKIVVVRLDGSTIIVDIDTKL